MAPDTIFQNHKLFVLSISLDWKMLKWRAIAHFKEGLELYQNQYEIGYHSNQTCS